MKFSSMKLTGALLASISLACAGPAWSADTAKKPVKTVAKHKVKHKAAAKTHHAVAPVAVADTPAVVAAVPAVAAVAAAPMVATVTAPAATPALVAPAVAPAPVETAIKVAYAPPANPYLAYQQSATPATPATPTNPWNNASKITSNLKSLLPSMPEGQSILPSIKKVYPTGEKPLVVLTFKCPTELIGITPIPTKALHGLVNYGFDAVNYTNLLSFNLQQVCQ